MTVIVISLKIAQIVTQITAKLHLAVLYLIYCLIEKAIEKSEDNHLATAPKPKAISTIDHIQ